MADTSFDEELAIHEDDSFSPSVTPFQTPVVCAPAFIETPSSSEMASDFQTPLLTASALPIGSSPDVRSDSPLPADQTALTEQVIVLPFTEGLVLDTSTRPWKLRGPISDLAAPISVFDSFGFAGSGFRPVPGSPAIFEAEITPAWSSVSLRISSEEVSPRVDSPLVSSASGLSTTEGASPVLNTNEGVSVLTEPRLLPGSSSATALAEPKLSLGPEPAIAPTSSAGLPLASPKMDSVRSALKVPLGERSFLREPHGATAAEAVLAQDMSCSDFVEAPPPFDGLRAVPTRPFLDPREGSPSLSGSSTCTDPKELEPGWVASHSTARSAQALSYSAPRSDFCALSKLNRTSEAIFFSSPPGSGPVFPPWSSASKLFEQEQRWRFLYAGVFPFKEASCYKWDLYAAPVLRRIFGIEGHPHWFIRQSSVDDSARADAFALCKALYDRASYYLSPAGLLWWVLARAQAAPGSELESIGERPRRLHQVPQSVPLKMTDSYARLAASS